MEPKPESFKPIVLVLWVALITAIIVTVIDWKLKQDILRIADTFYRVTGGPVEQNAEGTRLHNLGPVLPVPSVDSDARVEAENVSVNSDGEDHSGSWGAWIGASPDVQSGTADNSE